MSKGSLYAGIFAVAVFAIFLASMIVVAVNAGL